MPELHQRFNHISLRRLEQRVGVDSRSWYSQPPVPAAYAPFSGYWPTRCAIVMKNGNNPFGEATTVLWWGTRRLPWKWNRNKMPALFNKLANAIGKSMNTYAILYMFEFDRENVLRLTQLSPSCHRQWTNRAAMAFYYPPDLWTAAGYQADWTDNLNGGYAFYPVKVEAGKFVPEMRRRELEDRVVVPEATPHVRAMWATMERVQNNWAFRYTSTRTTTP